MPSNTQSATPRVCMYVFVTKLQYISYYNNLLIFLTFDDLSVSPVHILEISFVLVVGESIEGIIHSASLPLNVLTARFVAAEALLTLEGTFWSFFTARFVAAEALRVPTLRLDGTFFCNILDLRDEIFDATSWIIE